MAVRTPNLTLVYLLLHPSNRDVHQASDPWGFVVVKRNNVIKLQNLDVRLAAVDARMVFQILDHVALVTQMDRPSTSPSTVEVSFLVFRVVLFGVDLVTIATLRRSLLRRLTLPREEFVFFILTTRYADHDSTYHKAGNRVLTESQLH